MTIADSSSNIRKTRAKRGPSTSAKVPPEPMAAAPTKLDQLAALLADPAGATLEAMTAATGWQPHSVRGAMAGALKKRSLIITSEKVDGVRSYRASTSA